MSDKQHSSHVKVVVALERDEEDYPPADHENLWAEAVGGGVFRIDNIPFFAQGIAVGDLVSAEPGEHGLLRVQQVVQPSGHSTFRVIIYDKAEVPAVREFFLRMGCASELSHIPGLIAIDAPPSVSLDALRKFLDSGLESGQWDFEEACLGSG